MSEQMPEPVAWLVKDDRAQSYVTLKDACKPGYWVAGRVPNDYTVAPLYRAVERAPVEVERVRLLEGAIRGACLHLTHDLGEGDGKTLTISRVRAAYALLFDALAAVPVEPDLATGWENPADELGVDPEDEESIRCTCEWRDDEWGRIHARWPAELDPRCLVHRRPEAELEVWPEGFPSEYGAEPQAAASEATAGGTV